MPSALRFSWFCVVLAAVVAGCGGGGGGTVSSQQQGAPHAKAGGTLTFLYSGDVDNIDPGITYYTGGYLIVYATQRPLVNYKPNDPTHPVPDLAAALPEVSADHRTVTVKLRSGVKFSPPVNREVTSADVKYGIERAFFKTVNNGYAGVYFGDIEGAKTGVAPGTQIKGIQTPDPHTVVFKLTRPSGGVLAGALTMPIAAPVPRDYALPFDRHSPSAYGTHQVATGPYMIANDAKGNATGYSAGHEIKLVRNPSWDKATDYKPAYLDAIDVREGNTDTTVASRQVLSGSHMASGEFPVPAPIIKEALSRNKDQLALVPTGGIDYIPLNTSIPPFDDINVRKAVIAGFDRDAVRLSAGGKVRGPLATHFIPPSLPGFQQAGGMKGPALDFLAHPNGDPQLAAEYFRKAGYASGRYEGGATLYIPAINTPAYRQQGEVAQRSFERLGFKVRLRFVSSDVFYTQYCQVPARKANACVGWSWYKDFPDPQTMLDVTFNGAAIQPQGNSNFPQLKDPQVDAAMKKAETLASPAERAAAWGAIDKQVTAQAAAIPGTWLNQPIVRSKDVAGVTNPVLTGWDLTFTSLR
jgi:peptide/nickel transport system substrate-binding protein